MKIVGITGHQDIPDDALAYVRTGIGRALDPYGHDLTGVSSLAAGADQLFAEVVLQQCGQLHIVIPCQGYESTFEDEEALHRFRHLLDRAEEVDALAHLSPSEEAFLDAGRRIVELSQLLIAVWDGRQARGKGGTADIVNYARERQVEIIVIWPPGMAR